MFSKFKNEILSTGGSGYSVGAAVTTWLYSPMVYHYKNNHNRTYFTFFKRFPGGHYNGNGLACYDHDNRQLMSHVDILPIRLQNLSDDMHRHANLIVANDGHIIVAHEGVHNAGIFVRRSGSPEDINTISVYDTPKVVEYVDEDYIFRVLQHGYNANDRVIIQGYEGYEWFDLNDMVCCVHVIDEDNFYLYDGQYSEFLIAPSPNYSSGMTVKKITNLQLLFLTEGGAYPHLFKVGSRIYLMVRSNVYSIRLKYSDDNGQTWQNSPLAIDLAGNGMWPYPCGVNGSDETKLRFIINGYHLPTTNFHISFYLESSDGINFTNIWGNYTATTFNYENLSIWCTINNSGSNNIVNFITAAHRADATGRIFWVIAKRDPKTFPTTQDMILKCWNGVDDWIEKIITPFSGITVVDPADCSNKSVQGLYAYDNNHIIIFCLNDDSGKSEIERWQTIDGGVNWAKIGDITKESGQEHFAIMATKNANAGSTPLVLTSTYRTRGVEPADVRVAISPTGYGKRRMRIF